MWVILGSFWKRPHMRCKADVIWVLDREAVSIHVSTHLINFLWSELRCLLMTPAQVIFPWQDLFREGLKHRNSLSDLGTEMRVVCEWL